MAIKELDIRQSETRILQDQLNLNAKQQMDSTLASINSELTPPARLIAQVTPNLIVSINSGTVVNPNTLKKRVLPPIGNINVTFTGGTITFPSTSGTIAVSPGVNGSITIGANQFVAVLVQLDSTSNLAINVGVAAASLGAVVIPTGGSSDLSLGYIIVQSNGSSIIQPITDAMLYQFVEGSGSSGSGGTTVRSINAQTGTTYTFALSDGSNNGNNPLVTFGSSSDTVVTIPLNSSVAFPIGSQIDVIQVGTGDVRFVAPGGVTINSYNGSLSMLGQYTEVSLIKTATNTWDLYGSLASFISATGGTIITDGNFKVHTFTSSGTFQILAGGGTVDSLLIAGGGGGGGGGVGGQGTAGGGAGGMLYTIGTAINMGSYPVVVGAGGAGGIASEPGDGTSGTNSTFNSLIGIGGGYGGGSSGFNGGNGGSGGGTKGTVAGARGLGTAGQGNDGGTGLTGGNYPGGGGGGAGGTGGNAADFAHGGLGGIGLSNSITGSAIFYAGGGGGSTSVGGGTGGTAVNGGGAGGSNGPGTAGTANTGGGGGGGAAPGTGAAGGSGIAIIRYRFQ